MGFSALIAALLLEHFRPLPQGSQPYGWFSIYADFIEKRLDSGQHSHGVLAWFLAISPFVLVAVLFSVLLNGMSGLLGGVWSLLILYFLMGFGTVGANARAVASALKSQQLDQARLLLEKWTGRCSTAFSSTEVARAGIQEILIAFHHRLFGVIFWFVALGPGGVLLYRMAYFLAKKWGALNEEEFGDFGRFSVRALTLLEWLPSRLTAISFAVVGDFEDAMYCWRSQARQWLEEHLGIVVASGAGAIGVRLGENTEARGVESSGIELGLGEEADAGYMDSAVSLIWRALALWLALLLLFTLARWTGA